MSRLSEPVALDDASLGPPDAPLTLVEYGDYECPYCRRAQGMVKAVRAHLGDQLRYVWRHMPLTQIHPHAQLAAEAVEAAGAQGQFWQMHDQLFENQRLLGRDLIMRLAFVLGLDVDRFERDLRQARFREKVRGDFMSGVRSGVASTPTFFINEERYDDSADLEPLMAALVQRLAQTTRSHQPAPR